MIEKKLRKEVSCCRCGLHLLPYTGGRQVMQSRVPRRGSQAESLILITDRHTDTPVRNRNKTPGRITIVPDDDRDSGEFVS